MKKLTDIPENIRHKVHDGMVIPALPLALDEHKKIDYKHQKAMLRYYIQAGAGGIAAGVHSTQFEIRDPGIELFEPLLKFTSETIDEESAKHGFEILKITGICGKTNQALKEATFAADHGFHAGLLSLTSFRDAGIPEIIDHCREVSKVLPLVGFYLQPAVGGRVLPYEFWRKFAEIENVLAIKIAPFNRYYTLEVVRAICDAGREKDIALYTGNDDNILVDLLTTFKVNTGNKHKEVRIVGGLLGHWAVWTKKAVELLEDIKKWRKSGQPVPKEWLTLASQITDSNSAFFDTANRFRGSIPGIHEVLRRQGLMNDIRCLDPGLVLSDGQMEEIDRVYQSYPHLNDDAFVKSHIKEWLD